MSRWFRFYDDALNDPKVQSLRPELFKFWVNLLCVASKNDGLIPPLEALKTLLRSRLDHLEAYLEDLLKRGLLDRTDRGLEPHNWQKRQYKSDNSTDRVKRFRNGRRNVAETPPDNRVQSTDTEPKGSAADAAEVEILDENPRARLFRIGKPLLASWGVSTRNQGSLLGHWLKTRNDPEGLLAAIQFARDQNVAEPVAYISAVLMGKGNFNGRQGKQTLADLALDMARQARERELAAGIGRPDASIAGS